MLRIISVKPDFFVFSTGINGRYIKFYVGAHRDTYVAGWKTGDRSKDSEDLFDTLTEALDFIGWDTDIRPLPDGFTLQ